MAKAKGIRNRISTTMNERIMPAFAKMATQRHLLAIRNGIVQVLPFIIAGSIPLIIISFPIGEGAGDTLRSLMPKIVGDWMYWAYKWCFTSLALVAGIAVGAELAKQYRLNPTIGALLGGMSLLLWIVPEMASYGSGGSVVMERSIKITAIDSSAMLGAVAGALFSVEIYRFVVKHNITIKLPKEVPVAVSQAFVAIVPGIVIVIGITAIRVMLGFSFPEFMAITLQPIRSFVTDNVGGAILINFLICFFWWFGINLSGLINGMVRTFWLVGLDKNIAINQGSQTGTYSVFVEQFNQSFTQAGGSGNTLGMIIAILILSKSKQTRTIAKVSLIPGIFNINEPLIFGLPVMLNPYFFIPFMVAPILNVVLGWQLVQAFNIHLISAAPWTLPTPIFALFASGFQWQALILAIITIGFSFIVYSPFVILYDRSQRKLEQESQAGAPQPGGLKVAVAGTAMEKQ